MRKRLAFAGAGVRPLLPNNMPGGSSHSRALAGSGSSDSSARPESGGVVFSACAVSACFSALSSRLTVYSASQLQSSWRTPRAGQQTLELAQFGALDRHIAHHDRTQENHQFGLAVEALVLAEYCTNPFGAGQDG